MLVVIYIVLYISYVTFGTSFIRDFFLNGKLPIVDFKPNRMLYITYLGFLYNALYFNKPNDKTYSEALFINFLGLLGYMVFYRDFSGIIMHIIGMIPLFVYSKNFSLDNISRLTYLLSLVYMIFTGSLYKIPNRYQD